MKRLSISKILLTLCAVWAVGARGFYAGAVSDDPQPRTSLADPKVRFTTPDKPYVVLRRGPLEAVVVDNRAVDDDQLPGHRAGYHGLASLKHDRQGRNLF